MDFYPKCLQMYLLRTRPPLTKPRCSDQIRKCIIDTVPLSNPQSVFSFCQLLQSYPFSWLFFTLVQDPMRDHVLPFSCHVSLSFFNLGWFLSPSLSSWPWQFWRVQANYLVPLLGSFDTSSWLDPDCQLWQQCCQHDVCPESPIPRCPWSQFVPGLVMLTSIAWLIKVMSTRFLYCNVTDLFFVMSKKCMEMCWDHGNPHQTPAH